MTWVGTYHPRGLTVPVTGNAQQTKVFLAHSYAYNEIFYTTSWTLSYRVTYWLWFALIETFDFQIHISFLFSYQFSLISNSISQKRMFYCISMAILNNPKLFEISIAEIPVENLVNGFQTQCLYSLSMMRRKLISYRCNTSPWLFSGNCVNDTHSVETPRLVDPHWNMLYWGSKWNLHTVCWDVVGCEWGTTSVYFGITYIFSISRRPPLFAV